MRSGYVISDLHLFTEWSVAEDYLHEIQSAASTADFFVLNGDIFDFRWTMLPSVGASVDAAAEWLRSFAADHPRCRVFYVMGNHDCLQPFGERLDALTSETGNLAWHSSHLRLGSALFVHGDLFLRRNVSDPFSRPLAPAIRKKRRSLKRCYRLLHALRVHRWHSPVYGCRACARRMRRSLRATAHHAADGITDLYFGHTHLTLSDYTYDGLTFHNTGSMIRGLPWHMIRVRLPRSADLPSDNGAA